MVGYTGLTEYKTKILERNLYWYERIISKVNPEGGTRAVIEDLLVYHFINFDLGTVTFFEKEWAAE